MFSVWAGHVTGIEKGRSVFKVLISKPTGKRPLGRLGVHVRTILEWILKKWVSIRGIGLIRLRTRIIGKPL